MSARKALLLAWRGRLMDSAPNGREWRFVKHVNVVGDKWDLPERTPVGLAHTGLERRYMRRVGNRLEVA